MEKRATDGAQPDPKKAKVAPPKYFNWDPKEGKELHGKIEPWNIPLFDATTEVQEMCDFFEKWGVVAVKNAITEKESADARARFWNWTECLGLGIRQGDSSTYENWPGIVHKGMINIPGSGMVPVAERMNPKVQSVFKHLYKHSKCIKELNEPLVGNLDGMSVYRSDIVNDEAWPHVDQNLHNLDKDIGNGVFCIQGALHLLPATPESGGLVVVPGSQKHFTSNKLVNWDEVAYGHHFIVIQCHRISHGFLAVVPQDTLLCWSSGTAHWNCGPLKQAKLKQTTLNNWVKSKPVDNRLEIPKLSELPSRPTAPDSTEATSPTAPPPPPPSPSSHPPLDPKLLRLTYYVSYEPAKRLTPAAIKIKRQAIEECINTTHWSASSCAIHRRAKNQPVASWADEHQLPVAQRDERQPKYTLNDPEFREYMFGPDPVDTK
eukprot:TRINITY_DN67264_c6_g1_i2.p1 TRINITY_DN67264_c6_g1~~TRINITY_DN67264_c6_g1_i2.p1  ORF type:complete len:433 (+),score=46.83 TRINITY_DN67264_c6_g1_i2:23-1321(+)